MLFNAFFRTVPASPGPSGIPLTRKVSYLDIVCVDSSFIETKKGRIFRIQRPQKKEWYKDTCLRKL